MHRRTIAAAAIAATAFAAAATLASLLAGCAATPTPSQAATLPATAIATPETAVLHLPAASQLDADLPRLMQAAGVPGLAVALIDRGQVVHQRAFGLADRATQTPLRTDSIMYGASLTKAAFAWLVMQLTDEGVLTLDATLPQLLKKPLPDYPGFSDLKGDERWKLFTPRMLLSHTSGLLNWRWINEDKKLDIKFTPGSRYVYSGEGIQVLQLVVEERSGKPLGELMQKRVFDRFGMRDTSMVWRADADGRTVTHYDEAGAPLAHERRSRARAAGSMDTTLADMARFMAGVLRGDGLSPAAHEAMLSPQFAIDSPQQFPSHWPGSTQAYRPIGLAIGLGWPVYRSPFGPVFFKEGSDEGTNNLMLGFLRQGSGIVMLSNSANAKRLFLPAIEAAFGETCMPWFWMGYLPYDRPELLTREARANPPVSPACR